MATPKKLGAVLGRPPVPFLQDRDRYFVALMFAHMSVNGIKEMRPAAKAVAAMQVGNEVGVPLEIGKQTPPGFVAMGWGPSLRPRTDAAYVNTKPAPAVAATIEGRAATLRQKAARWRNDPLASEWLSKMAGALMLTMLPVKDATQAKDIVCVLAAGAGETEFAIKTIFPMIDMAAAAKELP